MGNEDAGRSVVTVCFSHAVSLAGDEPCGYISLRTGRVFHLDPLIVCAHLCLTAWLSDSEFIIYRHALDQGRITNNRLFTQGYTLAGCFHFDRTTRRKRCSRGSALCGRATGILNIPGRDISLLVVGIAY